MGYTALAHETHPPARELGTTFNDRLVVLSAEYLRIEYIKGSFEVVHINNNII